MHEDVYGLLPVLHHHFVNAAFARVEYRAGFCKGMAAESLVPSTLIGASLGALFAWAVLSRRREAPERAEGLGAYPRLCTDSILYVALQEPLRVFRQCDSAAAQELLESLDRLVGLFLELSAGSTAPRVVPLILKEKRDASNRLQALLRKAWKAHPFAASELEQDVQSIKNSLDGYVHNSMQQVGLNFSNMC